MHKMNINRQTTHIINSNTRTRFETGPVRRINFFAAATVALCFLQTSVAPLHAGPALLLSPCEVPVHKKYTTSLKSAEEFEEFKTRHIVYLKEKGLLHSMTATDVQNMFNQFEASNEKNDKDLVIHFHGGLVSRRNAEATALKMAPVYEWAGAYPMFFVWHSGYDEILEQRALQRGEKEEYEKWLSAMTRGFYSFGGSSNRLKTIDEDILRHRLIETNGLSIVPLPSLKTPEESCCGLDTSTRETADNTTTGNMGLVTVQPADGGAVQRARLRRQEKRGHGQWTTLLEEQLRQSRPGGHLQNVWHRMKCNIQQAWQDDETKGDEARSDETRGGVAFRQSLGKIWQKRRADGKSLTVTLVGHSAGAIYICEMLRSIARNPAGFKGLKFNLILLAPACDFQLLDRTFQESRQYIGHVRVFSMNDERERSDGLPGSGVRLYNGSLLYFISCVLETNEFYASEPGTIERGSSSALCQLVGQPEPADRRFRGADRPLVGMKRFYTNFYKGLYPSIKRVECFINERGGFVWAGGNDGPQYAGYTPLPSPGTSSNATTHGGFLSDNCTVASMQYLLRTHFHTRTPQLSPSLMETLLTPAAR